MKRNRGLSRLLTVMSAIISRPSGRIGLILIGAHILIAIASVYIAPYDYKAVDAKAILLEPSWQHWFGTDNLGRDLFTRTLLGGRQALLVTTVSTVFAILWGGLLGILLGLIGGLLDDLLMRVVDAFLSIPWILFLL